MMLSKTIGFTVAAAMIGSAALAVELTNDGKILQIDKAKAVVKIEHGPPVGTTGSAANRTFTYDYKVPNASLLDSVAVGDKVRFTAEGENQDWRVTKIQKQ